MISNMSRTYVRVLSRPGVSTFSDQSFSEHRRVTAADFMFQFLFLSPEKVKESQYGSSCDAIMYR